MIPVAGSAYTYGYATLGELPAWIIGWDLILEYMVAACLVSIGWSAYFVNLFNNILRGLGIALPPALVNAPVEWSAELHKFVAHGSDHQHPGHFHRPPADLPPDPGDQGKLPDQHDHRHH